jgi:ATP-dependent DNA helicase RecG
MNPTPQTSIQFLKGVGEKRAALYAKLRVFTVCDLLYHFPRGYIDLSKPYQIMQAPLLGPCAVRARLVSKSHEQRIRGGLSIFKLVAADDSGEMLITIFNAKYTVDSLKLDSEYIFYGQLTGSLLCREMSAPRIFPADGGHAILPVYPQTAGLGSNMMRKNINQALEYLGCLPDPLPESLRLKYNLGELNACLRAVHFPVSLDAAAFARERFIFEELLVLCCALAGLRFDTRKRVASAMRGADMSAFYDALPFSPTSAQLRCVGEITADLKSAIPMNRLVQGDVGSGKTMIAAAAIYFAWRSGFQCAMMAPTEILAEQHYRSLCQIFGPLGLRVELLTGSVKAADKRRILAGLADGSTGLCVGTHALISDGVCWHNLGLAVTDEQHRFGVAQRARLAQKAEDCHVLVMSATPIPRTLSLIIYGDLQLSILDELPPGRRPIETLVISPSKRERALGFVKKALDEGRQAYIVCPLIETGEVDMGLRPAVEYAAALREGELRGYCVGLLHGKMKPREKEDTMRRFNAGEIQALVSTTVVEVGVDVPNATIIMIENAERFGLSQLHQLRGRVGRGKHKSWCILVSGTRGANARQRLGAMKETSDGFKLAELDLNLRGPGDFFGERQHGLPELKVASLADNLAVMQKAQECAFGLLGDDPRLEAPWHALLRKMADDMINAART